MTHAAYLPDRVPKGDRYARAKQGVQPDRLIGKDQFTGHKKFLTFSMQHRLVQVLVNRRQHHFESIADAIQRLTVPDDQIPPGFEDPL